MRDDFIYYLNLRRSNRGAPHQSDNTELAQLYRRRGTQAQVEAAGCQL